MGPIDDRDLIPLRPAFDIVRRGYDRAQVDYRIEELQAYLRITTADSDAGAAQAAELTRQLEATRQELDEARGELQRLSAPPDTVEGLSARLKRMLRMAQDEAVEITARAEAAAAERMAEAERDAGGLRTRYEEMISETKRRRTEMEAEHQRVLAEAHRQAEEILVRARAQAEELQVEVAARCKQAEEDFEITMSARRREATQAMTEERETSTAEAQRRIAEATEAARRVVTEADHDAVTMVEQATRRVDQLRTVRHQVAEQLRTVHSMLDNAFAHLAPTSVEDSAVPGEPGDQAATFRPAVQAANHRNHPGARTVPWQRN
jgi:chromosome segregation ATPase